MAGCQWFGGWGCGLMLDASCFSGGVVVIDSGTIWIAHAEAFVMRKGEMYARYFTTTFRRKRTPGSMSALEGSSIHSTVTIAVHAGRHFAACSVHC